MDLLLGIPQMTKLEHVETLRFQINTIRIHQNISSLEEEKWSNMFNLRLINQVRIKTPCDPLVTHIQDGMFIHYFNRAIVNVSIGLAQDLMVYMLIGNIRVSLNKERYEKITNERHHSVTP